jgi:hypothetical protein
MQEGNRPLGTQDRCVNNSKMDLREIGWTGMDWIDLAEDCMNNSKMDLR